MIPQRVMLKGFLCYKDEQDVAFDGRSLWMLSGSNGSGKSAIFDAVTYSLFGSHRGGSTQAGELINKDCKGLTVEFEFLLDGQSYRIHRTYQRSARGSLTGSQQIFQRAAGHNGHVTWGAIDDTSSKKGFDAWIRDNIGLNYETFTSSVLLLQGNAEKLLNHTGKGRFEVLASIVDLERYQRLHSRADEQRRCVEGTARELRGKLAGLPEVTPQLLADTDTRIRETDAACRQARAEVDRWQDLLVKAHQWADLQTRLVEARGRQRQAEALLGDAAGIAAAVARLRELREVLPNVQTVLEQRGKIQESERQTAELARQQTQLTETLAQRQHALDHARRQRTALSTRIAADEERRRDVTVRFRQAAVRLEKVSEHDRQAALAERLRQEVSHFPADPTAAVRSARETCDTLTALSHAVPLLGRLYTSREQLRAARARASATAQARQEIETEGVRLAAQVDRLRSQVEDAVRAREQADGEVTRTSTLLQQTRDAVDEIFALEGAKLCRHCGQALTAGHIAVETERRQRDLAVAQKQAEQASGIQHDALVQERQLRGQFADLDRQLHAKRQDFRDRQHQADQSCLESARLEAECATCHADLAEPFRAHVSPAPPIDWLASAYPSAEELADLRRQAADLSAALQRLRQAEEVHQQWSALQSREAIVRQTLDRLRQDLGPNPGAVRGDHARLEAEDRALDQSLGALRAEDAALQQQLDDLARQREQTQQQHTELMGRLQGEERSRQEHLERLQRSRKLLSPAWQAETESAGLRRVHLWQQEQETLIQQRAEERGRDLEQARAGLDLLRRDLAELERRQNDFPPDARQDPAAIGAHVQEAREAQRLRDDEASQARVRRHTLGQYEEQREELQQELLAADQEHVHAKLLADLLGRDRLQLHLVRQAERQVVDYANAVLDRLSSGQLYLRLCGEAAGEGNTAKALELEAYNRRTGEQPINVAFLSGSQRFRVAVSLALGIGQYASRQHRPIESVIIDEGFGCLDKDGRQVMIQELQNLRGHLRCILLVSHQEEFANAFADGYRFELTDGATRVTRFQP